MNASVAPRRYLVVAGSLLGGLLALVAACNWFVDPYGLFDSPRIDGVNARKTRADQEVFQFKAAAVARSRPRTLVLGNSRAEIGFDPDGASWPAAMRPVFNGALPGTGPGAAARMLSIASAQRVPDVVLLGVDFPDFLRAPGEREAPLERAGIGPPERPGLETIGRSLVSLDSLRNSLLTVATQRSPFATEVTASGFNPLRDYVALVRNEGHGQLFAQKDAEYAARLRSGPRDVTVPGAQDSPEFAQVREIVRFCRENRVRLRLVVYPYHADVLETFDHAGLWQAYERWKRLLTALVAAEAAAGADVELWDFGTYGPRTTEIVPKPGDTTTAMRYYWEAGHFKPALGDEIVAQLFAGGPPLGRRLEPGNVEDVITAMRTAQLHFRIEQPAAVERVARIFRGHGAPSP
jgi:hypothetical protein